MRPRYREPSPTPQQIERASVPTLCATCGKLHNGVCQHFGGGERGERRRIRHITGGTCRHYSLRTRGTVLAEPFEQFTFVATEQLITDAKLLMSHVLDCDAVVGIARSGLLPASVLATMLHLPLFSCGKDGSLTFCGRGTRSVNMEFARPRKILLIDDTTASGGTLRRTATIVKSRWPASEVVTAAIYGVRATADITVRLYPGLHILEWNFFNAPWSDCIATDIDGVLIEDGRILQRPHRAPVPVVVSARGMQHYEATARWLASVGITYRHLLMPDEPLYGEAAGDWKAKALEPFVRNQIVRYVVESESVEAQIMHERLCIPVVCYREKKVYWR